MSTVNNLIKEHEKNKEDIVGINEQLAGKVTFHTNKFISKLKNGEPATVVFLGDSTTAQIDEHTGGQPNHVGILQGWLESLYPNLVTVVNAGIGGNNIKQMWQRVYSDVLIHDPDLVIICSALNDSSGGNSLTLDEYRNCYNMIIQEILAQGHRDIILRTSNPFFIGSTYQENLGIYNNASIEVAKKYNVGVFDLYTKMLDDATKGIIDQSSMMYDGTHPNALGQNYIAELFKDYFTPKQFIKSPTKIYNLLSGLDAFKVFTSGASEGISNAYTNGKYIFINQTNKYIETEFIGGDFSILYREHTSNGQFICTIDGVDQPLVDTYSLTSNSRGFVTYKVPFGRHKVRITNQPTKNVDSSSYILNICGILYEKEGVINEGAIIENRYTKIEETIPTQLTSNIQSIFKFNSVVDDTNLIDFDMPNSTITINKYGLYSILFSDKVVTTENADITIRLVVNNLNYYKYDETSSRVGTHTKTVDLVRTMELNQGDIIKIYVIVGGTTPTMQGTFIITKLG